MSTQRNQRGPSWLEDYVSVDERLATFRAAHPKARIVTQLLERETLTFRAEIYLEDNESNIPNAVGHADVEGGSGNRKQSPVEKTETAAIGRALDVMGVEGTSEPQRVASKAQHAPLRAAPTGNVDADIMTALQILGKTEEGLNEYARKNYDLGLKGDWTDLSPTDKDDLLAVLNRQVDKVVAQAK